VTTKSSFKPSLKLEAFAKAKVSTKLVIRVTSLENVTLIRVTAIAPFGFKLSLNLKLI